MLIAASLLLILSAPPADIVTVTLTAPDAAGSAFELRRNESLANSWQGETVASGRVASAGRSEVQAEIVGADTALLVVDGAFRRLWIAPGDVDVEVRDGAWRFGGSLGDENTLLETLRTRAWPRLDGDWAAFATNVAAERAARSELVDRALGTRDDLFARYVRALVVADAAITLGDALALAAFDPAVTPPADAAAFWSDVPLFDDDVGALCDPCRRAVAGRLGHEASAEHDPSVDRGAWMRATLQRYADALDDHPRTHERLATSLADFAVQYLDPADADAAVRDVTRRFPDSPSRAPLTDALARAVGVDVETLATDVSFVDVDGRPRRLDEFRGRVVYIDLWGAWCAACMALTSDLRELARALPDDVVVLGIDMLDDAETWRATVTSKRLPGEQWKPATGADEERVAELLALRAYPRFVILDRDGVLTSASAPPPGEALDVLRALAEG